MTRFPGEANAGRYLPLFGGLCFFLAAIEFVIPKPLPFLRIGLANLPVLLAADILPFPAFTFLIAIKTAGHSLISGTLFSFTVLFSLAGTTASALLMYALRRGIGRERIGFVGVSAAGAFASNGAQLLLAYFFIFGESVRYAAPPILSMGIVTGTALGVFCERFSRRSLWYKRCMGGAPAAAGEAPPGESPRSSEPAVQRNRKPLEKLRARREAFCLDKFSSSELAAAGLCLVPALLVSSSLFSKAVQVALFFLLAWLCGKKINLLITLSIGAGIVFFNLLVPHGELLFAIAPLQVTRGALLAGAERALVLQGLFVLSRCCIRQDLKLPGLFGRVLSESLRVFSVLSELSEDRPKGKPLAKKGWAAHIDKLIFRLEAGLEREDFAAPPREENTAAVPKRKSKAARLILLFVVALTWLIGLL